MVGCQKGKAKEHNSCFPHLMRLEMHKSKLNKMVLMIPCLRLLQTSSFQCLQPPNLIVLCQNMCILHQGPNTGHGPQLWRFWKCMTTYRVSPLHLFTQSLSHNTHLHLGLRYAPLNWHNVVMCHSLIQKVCCFI